MVKTGGTTSGSSKDELNKKCEQKGDGMRTVMKEIAVILHGVVTVLSKLLALFNYISMCWKFSISSIFFALILQLLRTTNQVGSRGGGTKKYLLI